MEVDVVLFDWGWTLAAVTGQVEAFRRGAEEVVELLTGTPDARLVENLLAEALAAEAKAAAEPELREVDLGLLLKAWAAERGIKTDDASRAEAIRVVGRRWIGALTPMAGAIDAVERLRIAGFRLGLVSNCFLPPEYCRQELTRQGFAELLNFALFSSEVGYRKPSPIVYETALRRLGLDGPGRDLSRVLFVGDSPAYDVIAPARMGMRTALVQSRHGMWPQADFEQAAPDLHLRTIAELPALLRRG